MVLTRGGVLMITIRLRSIVWFVTGAMLTATAMLVFANAWRVDAAPGDADTTFVPLAEPCRLIDTRPPPTRVGTIASFGVADTQTLQATGTNGDCTIPADAVGLSLNVTALNATTTSFLTFWPDGTQPLVSSLNPSPGQPPVPNAVTVALSASGSFNIFNNAGQVDVIVDVNGYSTNASLQELTDRLIALESSTAALETATAALDAAQPFTVASAPNNGTSAGSSPRSIGSVVVTAPVDGQVAAVASAYMFEDNDTEFVECGLMDTITDPPVNVGVFWQSPTDGDFSHVSTSRVFDIAAGTTVRYHLVCLNGSGGTSIIYSPQVTAVFTPSP